MAETNTSGTEQTPSLEDNWGTNKQKIVEYILGKIGEDPELKNVLQGLSKMDIQEITGGVSKKLDVTLKSICPEKMAVLGLRGQTPSQNGQIARIVECEDGEIYVDLVPEGHVKNWTFTPEQRFSISGEGRHENYFLKTFTVPGEGRNHFTVQCDISDDGTPSNITIIGENKEGL